MEKQKTAVEWLIEKNLTEKGKEEFEYLINQAKQIEKEQITRALNEFLDFTLPDEACDEYYESKYGKDE